MKVACANPGCPNLVSRPLFRGVRQRGLERDGRWYCRPGCLAAVLADQAMAARRRGLRRTERRVKLGLLLLKNNLIERDKLTVALEQRGHSLKKLGEILVDSGYLTEKDLNAALAVQAGIAQVSLDPGQKVRLKGVIPVRLLAEFGFVVFNHDDIERELSVALHDTDLIPLVEDFFARLMPDHRVRFFFEERRKIVDILQANFPESKIRSETGESAESGPNGEGQAETVIFRYVEFLNNLPAADIRVEHQDDGICVTARVEGLRIETRFARP